MKLTPCFLLLGAMFAACDAPEVQGELALPIIPTRNVAPGARNVVLWRWSDSLPARLAVIDPEGRLAPVSPGADPKPR